MNIHTGMLLILSILLLVLLQNQKMHGISAATINLENSRLRPHRPLNHPVSRIPARYGKVHQESISDFLDDDDLFDFPKRQVTDDYGHLRFGKRGDDFDDYGHLRFGRSGDKK